MKRRTEFIDVEHRGFELSDVGHTNDSLLAAMVADETIAEAWEENRFEGMYFAEAQDAMAAMWTEAKRVSLAHLNRALWLLNIPKGLPS
jgi:hypothetical protein